MRYITDTRSPVKSRTTTSGASKLILQDFPRSARPVPAHTPWGRVKHSLPPHGELRTARLPPGGEIIRYNNITHCSKSKTIQMQRASKSIKDQCSYLTKVPNLLLHFPSPLFICMYISMCWWTQGSSIPTAFSCSAYALRCSLGHGPSQTS